MIDSYEFSENLKKISAKIENIHDSIEPERLENRLNEIEKLQSEQSFWDNQEQVVEIEREKNSSSKKLNIYNNIKSDYEDIVELYELAVSEDDKDTLKSVEESFDELSSEVTKLELELLLSDELDGNNAIVNIHPGAGGTESQDWAQMLQRMYMRWAELRGFKVEVLDIDMAEDAGIKDVSMLIKGENAYGYLKHESGVHRLVRISPFDSNAKRHTSFSSVIVSAEIDDTINIEIDDKDLKIDTYRASGAGGQHVNKTDSAIRIKHIPTGIVVQCQNDRSQHKNKSSALKMLKSRLYEHELMMQNEEKNSTPKEFNGWGSQIRSYVLTPYQQVKDTRTNVAYSNVDAILNGEIDNMLQDLLLFFGKSGM